RRPCPAFHAPGFDPGRHLVEKARTARADGVVFLLTKFCDPWFFDYPHVNQALEDAGIPTLLVEVEQHLPVPEQFRTRIQAFFEMLAAR
ncbi:MAG TPA: 2-hydroxyacyl-CoA dehydratase family protein, partial [Candidatus Hydrogenedentes bacterium]|nr:2-hydroxyacyl-CoA dehydratase family protein [Candidatus Hydrogenedentota bacterium]